MLPMSAGDDTPSIHRRLRVACRADVQLLTRLGHLDEMDCGRWRCEREMMRMMRTMVMMVMMSRDDFGGSELLA